MRSEPYYLVRELQTTKDLLPFLRLRYKVFGGMELRSWLSQNEHGIDLDAWDKYSRHFGMFKIAGSQEQPVGFMRFVSNVRHISSAVAGITDLYPTLKDIAMAEPPILFPALKGHLQHLSIATYHKIEKAAPGKIIECGRFAISEEIQKNQLLASFFADVASAICLLVQDSDGIFQVNEHHLPFYSTTYGYKTISKTNYAGLVPTFYLLLAQKEMLRPNCLPRLKTIADTYRETGCICNYPQTPSNPFKPLQPLQTPQTPQTLQTPSNPSPPPQTLQTLHKTMPPPIYYLIRELQTAEELLPFLRLRYTVGRASEIRFIIPENPYGIDLDAWDKYATHFGLFRLLQDGKSQPIGNMRFIGNNLKRSDAIFKLTQNRPLLQPMAHAQPSTLFPALKRHASNIAPEMLEQIQCTRAGNTIETSRFMLLDKVQGTRRLAQFFVDAVSAIFLLEYEMDVVFQVNEHHQPFYEQQYGYQTIAKTKFPEVDHLVSLLFAQKETLNPRCIPRLKKMTEAFRETACICLRPDEPGVYYAPKGLVAAQIPQLETLNAL